MHSRRKFRAFAPLWTLLLPLLAACSRESPPADAGTDSGAGSALTVPVVYDTLANGLKVVFSRDTTSPTVGVGVYYHVGFRNEPRNRTGFAHLFEHLMFQGSANLGKLEFIKLIESNGGILNGSTRFDFTNYFQIVPSHTLETILWAEADRMKGLAIDGTSLQNQKDVVKNEVRVNVLNQPYGSFPWIDLPMAAHTNWYNAHNFYGELKELDAATLEDASAFFKTYYAPNNAVVVVVGDFEPVQATAWVTQYFADIPAVPQPERPDIAEPRQEKERRASRTDALANRPALGVAYHVPERWTADWFAFGLIDQILAQGRDSRLYDALVQRAGLTSDVNAGINFGLGNMFNYEGPMLWMLAIYHDKGVTADSLLRVIDGEVEALRTTPVDSATLARARTKMRSSLYGVVDEFAGLGKLDLLASFALFDSDPARFNRLEAEFAKVTPEQLRKTAQEYLRKENRTVYTVKPGAKDAPTASAQEN
ncbi:MAG: insulinase family protein [Gemmatimonadaceae bacterium]|jgi:zinc protease|nr:insulinase family protein [Gemmatimonadota bacterium]MBK8057064.1 insulinase family protein [Gemmatimonadota bacterium]MBP9106798.1 insulinase family protein [Gemmatimonadaceae bacterium]MCC7323384.1 insulinase family protein [Gemmatimonadaceae bacterium]HNV77434.1 pitrilysin family protein [Gemmatimonadaceae bacterium]